MPTIQTPQPLPLVAPTSGAERWRRLAEAINTLIRAVAALISGGGGGSTTPGGTWNGTFLSGSIQYNNNGAFGGLGDFQYGLNLPNASGTPGPGLLLAGAGKTQVALICDEQLSGQKGITLIIEAGDASASGAATDDSGDLLAFAGGTLNGDGGVAKYQGGTSVHARAGDVVIHGGNSTNGTPGNAVIMGGETGTAAGSSTLLFMIKPTGAPSFGDVRIVKGDGGGPPGGTSTILIQFLDNGEIYLTSSGTGAGLATQPLISQGIGAPAKWYTGFTGSKVIGGQTYTWKSGLLDSVV